MAIGPPIGDSIIPPIGSPIGVDGQSIVIIRELRNTDHDLLHNSDNDQLTT